MKSALLVAMAFMASGFGPTPNTDYTQQKDRQRKEHSTALIKKQRVREQIRARRKEKP